MPTAVALLCTTRLSPPSQPQRTAALGVSWRWTQAVPQWRRRTSLPCSPVPWQTVQKLSLRQNLLVSIGGDVCVAQCCEYLMYFKISTFSSPLLPSSSPPLLPFLLSSSPPLPPPILPSSSPTGLGSIVRLRKALHCLLRPVALFNLLMIIL